MENKTHDEMNLWHCGANFCKGNWKNCLFRWILGAVILAIVFGFGFKLGKFSALFSGGYYSGTGSYGYPMMSGSYSRGNMMYPGIYGNNSGYYYGPGMMQGWGQPQTLPPTLR